MAAGRPRVYETAEELEKEVESYWTQEVFTTVMGGEEIPMGRKPRAKLTVTGLAYHLGFESRQSIYDYKENGEFSYIVKRAILRIEQAYEENLTENNVAGSIFALKNMGWKDKTETGFTDSQGNDIAPVQIIQLPSNKRDDSSLPAPESH